MGEPTATGGDLAGRKLRLAHFDELAILDGPFSIPAVWAGAALGVALMDDKVLDAAKVLADTPLVNAASAPLIYFEAVSNQGGITMVNVTLVAFLHLPNKEGGVDSVPSTVAHLRCPRNVAIALRDSLDTAIKNGEPPPPDASVN